MSLPDLPDVSWKRRFRRRLRAWFNEHARDLPWRRTRDPYAIWVSEIMLQQTQVVTVIPYYQRFLQRFPNVRALAAASEEDVLRLWEGLGYYRRARQLHRAAQTIVEQHEGQFPTDSAAILRLPGIGRYTAGAILSIAFDAREPIVEANTYRFLSRLLAYRGDGTSKEGQDLLWRFAEDLLPQQHAGAFNQALMEVGSEICTPRDPACCECPVQSLCPTWAQSLQDEIPRPKRKQNYEQLSEACVVVWKRGRVLLRQCGPDERWAGLWDFPRFPIQASEGPALQRELARRVGRQTGIQIRPRDKLMTIKHGVTRYRITLSCFEATYVAGVASNKDARWTWPARLTEFPLSVTGRKISNRLQSDR